MQRAPDLLMGFELGEEFLFVGGIGLQELQERLAEAQVVKGFFQGSHHGESGGPLNERGMIPPTAVHRETP